MRAGVLGLPEDVAAIVGRRGGPATLACTVVACSMRRGARAEHRYRCLWRADGSCREERAASTVLAGAAVRWEIPRHAGPVVTGPRAELLVDTLVDPRPLFEGREARVVDESAWHEGRSAVIVEVESPPTAREYDRVLTLDAEFGIVLAARDLVSGREIRLTGVRFNEELDPALFAYRPEPWRTLIHTRPC